jgi:drug/metabolite transporter (DMT)-like permease
MKIAYNRGFSTGEVLNGQFFFGWWMLLGLVLLFCRINVRGAIKKWFLLSLLGANLGLSYIFYGLALQTLPVSITMVFLFQFIWMGLVIEAVAKKEWPSSKKLLSISLVLAGAVLIGGVLENRIEITIGRGVAFALSSAITYAIFIYASGGVATDMPPLVRSFFMTTGSMVLLLIVFKPTFLFNGSLTNGLWKYGMMLGVVGIALPILFFAIGVPRIGPGLATILSAAELPVAVITSFILLKEKVTYLQSLGIVFILLGIVIPQIRIGLNREIEE